MKLKDFKIKTSRQLGLPLTPKAIRFMERRPYPPGEHGAMKRRFTKQSDYKRQLLEKQRLRAQYNIQERQMRNYVRKAVRKKGNTADNLIQMLETRLDAVVFRAGIARTIFAARQYVSHSHILLNGKWVNIPSHQVTQNEVVSVKKESRKLPCFIEAQEEMVSPPPAYLTRDKNNLSAKLLYLPKREEVTVSGEITLVIEYYSR